MNTVIESVTLKEGKLEVIYRKPPDYTYAVMDWQTPPDDIWKDIYGVNDGQIVLEKTVRGKHVPQQVIPERIEFEDGDSMESPSPSGPFYPPPSGPFYPLTPNLPNTPVTPVWPTTPYSETINCSKCGLKCEKVMGYVCNDPECPMGFGPTICKN